MTISASLRRLGRAIVLVALAAGAQANLSYSLVDDYNPLNFFDKFTFNNVGSAFANLYSLS
jgi:hypothetical protein